MIMMNEQIYIARVLAGETDTYRELVERYQTGLIIHCENILRDRTEAEDIAQEAFLKRTGVWQIFPGRRLGFLPGCTVSLLICA